MLRKLATWLAVALCTVAVGACTSEVRGTPSAVVSGGSGPGSEAPSAVPSPGSSSSGGEGSGGSGDSDRVLKKFRLADPCSFVDESTFAAIGAKPQFSGTGMSSYTNCFTTLQLKQNGKQAGYSISSQFADGSSPQEVGAPLSARLQKRTVGGNTVLSGNSSAYGCINALVLGEQLSLVLAARTTAGNNDPCTISAAMVSSAARRATQGDFAQLQGAGNTPAGIDFCAALGDAAQTLLGGDVSVKPSLHGCSWVAGSNSVIASLRSDSWPPGFPGPNSHPQTLGEHPALVGSTQRNGRTLSISEIRLSPSRVGNGKYDQITVVAGLDGSGSGVQSRIQAFLTAAARVS